mgnify:CR=1 FL=1
MDDIFNIDFLDSKKSGDGLANSLRNGDDKLNNLRTELFNGIYDNLLNTIKNTNKYLKKNHCVYSIPPTFNGVVIYKELRKCFMKHVIIRLNREKFDLNLINKNTILIKW